MPAKLDRIGHCLIRVRDVERAKRFYMDVLGFQFMEQDPDHGGVFLSLPGDGHTIDLIARGRPGDGDAARRDAGRRRRAAHRVQGQQLRGAA